MFISLAANLCCCRASILDELRRSVDAQVSTTDDRRLQPIGCSDAADTHDVDRVSLLYMNFSVVDSHKNNENMHPDSANSAKAVALSLCGE